MRIAKLLQDAVGGVLGLVGMTVALIRGGKIGPQGKQRMKSKDEEEKRGVAEKEKHRAMARRGVKEATSTPAVAVSAMDEKKGAHAKRKNAKKAAPAKYAKGAKKVDPGAAAKS